MMSHDMAFSKFRKSLQLERPKTGLLSTENKLIKSYNRPNIEITSRNLTLNSFRDSLKLEGLGSDLSTKNKLIQSSIRINTQLVPRDLSFSNFRDSLELEHLGSDLSTENKLIKSSNKPIPQTISCDHTFKDFRESLVLENLSSDLSTKSKLIQYSSKPSTQLIQHDFAFSNFKDSLELEKLESDLSTKSKLIQYSSGSNTQFAPHDLSFRNFKESLELEGLGSELSTKSELIKSSNRLNIQMISCDLAFNNFRESLDLNEQKSDLLSTENKLLQYSSGLNTQLTPRDHMHTFNTSNNDILSFNSNVELINSLLHSDDIDDAQLDILESMIDRMLQKEESSKSFVSKYVNASFCKKPIPKPPPNLQEVDMKLYPHRFKIKLKDIITYGIPDPPPNLPEFSMSNLSQIIPLPPPDIPFNFRDPPPSESTGTINFAGLQQVKQTIHKISIPAPPPNIDSPPNTHGNTINYPINDRSLHLNEIRKVAEERERLRTKKNLKNETIKSDKSVELRNSLMQQIKKPPIKVKNDKINKPQSHYNSAENRTLHLQEISNISLKKEQNKTIKKHFETESKIQPLTSIHTNPNTSKFHQSQHIKNSATESRTHYPTAKQLKPKHVTFTEQTKVDISKNFEFLIKEIKETSEYREDILQDTAKNMPNWKYMSPIKIKTRLVLTNLLSLPELSKVVFTELNTESTGQQNEFIINSGPESNYISVSRIRDILESIDRKILYRKSIYQILPDIFSRIPYVANYPNLTTKHDNYLHDHLTYKCYKQLYTLVTDTGFTLDQAIQTGVDNATHPTIKLVGCVAGDANSYEIFAPLFDPIIASRHKLPNLKGKQVCDFEASKLTNFIFDSKFVISCRISSSRSIHGFPFPPNCNISDRRAVLEISKDVLHKLPYPFSGKYHLLSEISTPIYENLIKKNLIFRKPTSFIMTSSKMGRNWPDARGIWLNKANNFAVWVNAEDHLKFIALGCFNSKTIFEKYCLGVHLFEAYLNLMEEKFEWSDKLGYLVTCPSNVGTGLRISVHIKLPNFAKCQTKLLKWLESRDLQMRGSPGVDDTNFKSCVFDISNKNRLHLTEVQILQNYIDSIQALCKMEASLETN